MAILKKNMQPVVTGIISCSMDGKMKKWASKDDFFFFANSRYYFREYITSAINKVTSLFLLHLSNASFVLDNIILFIIHIIYIIVYLLHYQ